MRSFETWTYEEVEDVFGIVPKRNNMEFEEWLKGEGCEPDDSKRELLDEYRNLLFDEVKNWNEDELKLFFIGPVLASVNFNTSYFKPFTQRTLSVQHGDISASGKVDFLLAKGKLTPKIPYFCLHEYKQENRRDNDPLGQLLIGMVAAQAKNANDLPVYGCYVSGRNWFFVMLKSENYFLSDAYVATSEDIYQIFAILKKCKTLIEAHSQAA
jgi:hypothetical protein